MSENIIIFAGHGSRDPESTREFITFVDAYRDGHPELTVVHAFVELAEPGLAKVLEDISASCRQVVVVPISLFSAGHVKNEIPLLVEAEAQKKPGVRFHITPSLGIHPRLIELVLRQAEDHGIPLTDTAVLVVGRGSSDPDANGDLYKAARLIGEGLKTSWVLPCFIGITPPDLATGLDLAARARPKHLVIVPYFLFRGVLLTRIDKQVAEFAAQNSWIKVSKLPHLAASPLLLDAVNDRVQEALKGAPPLPCMTCQYRVPIGKISSQVGGLNSLLYSLRHSFTHKQAVPHKHAHKPIKKHVLICTNTDCAARGSVGLVEKLRRLIKDAKQQRFIRVTKTSCMGRCGEGPTVVIYPDGIWYREINAEDLPELVDEHLINDRLLSRRVDHMM